jgi:hypothetical protein
MGMREQYETPVDKAIREARERGEFDNLPGSGKPLRNLGNPDDADWWIKAYAAREGLDLSAAMPPVLALRKEAASFPESLLELATEASVRAVLEDFNRRVKQDRLRPATGPTMPVVAPTVDVDAMVERWLALRAAAAAKTLENARAVVEEPAESAAQRDPWWRRLLRGW